MAPRNAPNHKTAVERALSPPAWLLTDIYAQESRNSRQQPTPDMPPRDSPLSPPASPLASPLDEVGDLPKKDRPVNSLKVAIEGRLRRSARLSTRRSQPTTMPPDVQPGADSLSLPADKATSSCLTDLMRFFRLGLSHGTVNTPSVATPYTDYQVAKYQSAESTLISLIENAIEDKMQLTEENLTLEELDMFNELCRHRNPVVRGKADGLWTTWKRETNQEGPSSWEFEAEVEIDKRAIEAPDAQGNTSDESAVKGKESHSGLENLVEHRRRQDSTLRDVSAEDQEECIQWTSSPPTEANRIRPYDEILTASQKPRESFGNDSQQSIERKPRSALEEQDRYQVLAAIQGAIEATAETNPTINPSLMSLDQPQPQKPRQLKDVPRNPEQQITMLPPVIPPPPRSPERQASVETPLFYPVTDANDTYTRALLTKVDEHCTAPHISSCVHDTVRSAIAGPRLAFELDRAELQHNVAIPNITPTYPNRQLPPPNPLRRDPTYRKFWDQGKNDPLLGQRGFHGSGRINDGQSPIDINVPSFLRSTQYTYIDGFWIPAATKTRKKLEKEQESSVEYEKVH